MSNPLPPIFDHWRNRYLLMRHGHSEANRQGLIVSSPEMGVSAYGLSAQGERQLAECVAQWRWPQPTRVVHSDFLRTTQTAQRVADAFGLERTADVRLRERHFGELDGEADRYYPDVWAQDALSGEHRYRQVEALSSVAARLEAVIAEWEAAVANETLLIVSHGDPLQILLTALSGRPLTEHREQPALAPASITLIGARDIA